MPRPHPVEFRQRAVELARLGEKPIARIAEDLGISESCLHRWVKLADIEDGVRPGVTFRDRVHASHSHTGEDDPIPVSVKIRSNKAANLASRSRIR